MVLQDIVDVECCEREGESELEDGFFWLFELEQGAADLDGVDDTCGAEGCCCAVADEGFWIGASHERGAVDDADQGAGKRVHLGREAGGCSIGLVTDHEQAGTDRGFAVG